MSLKLSDETIAHIAKIIQVAILSGTDIVDHLRLLTLVKNDNNYLVPSPETSETFEKNIQNMLNEIEQKNFEKEILTDE